ncbi:serine/arginine repetitive matrix protein 2 [Drosophila elegans]|uniref:serine/arginine repetitive matrix protein 2 n=1 Tax=Drosophila elegans TaxID=30023 RepID=UPI001BC8604C|nr:serine/arginine repetitive matrix protein 2 [Drosophila elegans]
MSQAVGGSVAGMEELAPGNQSKPPEDLQDNDTNSLEPGEVVTPPHNHPGSPALKKHLSKDLMIGKTLKKITGGMTVEPARKENGSMGTPQKQSEEADDSEGLYSDSDSSGEDLKNLEDVQKARKEKQEEAAAAALPQAPPTPFLGINPLRFHMRAPCFEFPRMGFMPRMTRGGPRGMRPPFFGRPPTPNRMGSPMMGGPPAQGPSPGSYGQQVPPGQANNSNTGRCKRPQSDLAWTALQPPVSFVFNLVSECSNLKHENCRSKADTAAPKSKEATSETKDKSTDQSNEQDRSMGKTREKSQHRDAVKEKTRKRSRGKTKERSKERDSTRGNPREKSKDGDLSRGKTREKSKERDVNRGKTRETVQETNQAREKKTDRSKDRDQTGGETRTSAREKSQVSALTRGKTKDRSRERDQTRAKTPERFQARDHASGKTKDRDHTRAISREKRRENSRERTGARDKHRDFSKEKLKEQSTEHAEKSREESKDKYKKMHEENHSKKQRDGSKEKIRRRSRERVHEKTTEKVRDKATEEANQNKDIEKSSERTIDKLPGLLVETLDERFKEKQRKRSREKSTAKCLKDSVKDKSREHSREKPKERKDEKCSDLSRENEFGTPKERGMDRPRKAATPHYSSNENTREIDHKSKRKDQANSSWEGREGTPPTTPPQVQQIPPGEALRPKGYDIFADSPPRPITAVTAPAVFIERSTTPPLKAASVFKPDKLTPLLKASEIHSRIGALLEDSDLHLEALLATKEQLFRRTNEYKERKEAPKKIKTEPMPNSSSRRSGSDRVVVDHHNSQSRHVNPFKRESVLSERKSSPRPSSRERRLQRNGSQSEEDWDKDLERGGHGSRSQPRRSEEYKEISIKIEKDLTPPPQQPALAVPAIKIERKITPPREAEREILVRNGAVAANAPPPAKEQESPDTDDYIDNWENDDSMASMPKNAPPATPTPTPTAALSLHLNTSLNATPLPPPATQFNGDDDDSNALWNANSTPPPRAKDADLPTSNIHELYDKFMSSIKMSNEDLETETEAETLEASKNSSLSNSTADESSSGTETSSTSSSSSESGDDSSPEDEDANEDSSGEETLQISDNCKANLDDVPGKEQQQKKNSVSKDLRKLKSLEDNLARIQMMRENYDAGDEISEELLKMESLFLMQRNAIMDKYRKQELKSNASEDQQPVDEQENPQQPVEIKQSAFPVNNIFDANREAIKLTISPLKLTRKSAIFDKDEQEQPEPSKLAEESPKPALQRPPKEIAIVKPTIVKSRSKPRILRSPPPPAGHRRRSRSRSISRNRSRRRGSRPKSRSPSPRRWRPPSPRRGSRYGKRIGGVTVGGIKIGRSHSRSVSRSRTRSRSPNRRRRLPPIVGHRKRGSLSPVPAKMAGPRSPPPRPRSHHSLSRDRDRDRERDREREHFSRSRSPLPFKPPSPPMRRSWSKSRSPTRRRSYSRSRSRSISPRARSPTGGDFMNYFEENQGMEMEAAAYYYNMSLTQQEDQDAMGEGYDMYAAYMDSAYNMEQAYAQYSEDYSSSYGDYMGEMVSASSPQPPGSVLRELPMAPMVPMESMASMTPMAPMVPMLPMVPMASVVPVAVQKGNVLEIVPSGDDIMEPQENLLPAAIEEPIEDKSKPKRKSVNFVDNVLPTYESDNEDRAAVGMAVERALRQYQERRSQAAAKLQMIRDELLSMPPPPPPLTPKPDNLEKPVLVQKKPKFRYFHFDPIKGAIVKTHARMLRSPSRPPFDPKHFAMLMKTGRLPQFPPGFLRHRPPMIPAHVDPATRSAMLKEFFSKHPPPPLPMSSMPMPDGMPYYLSGPPPMPSGAVLSPVPVNVLPQPIPVLDGSGYQGYPQPVAMVPSPVPVPGPVPVPVPVPVPLPVPVPVPVPSNSTPPPATIAPYFTPPPLPELPILPELPTQFSVSSVPTITEIMPVDILQKLGPLPKTLDVDDGGGICSPEEAGNDLKEAEAEPTEQPAVDVKPQLLVETQ